MGKYEVLEARIFEKPKSLSVIYFKNMSKKLT